MEEDVRRAIAKADAQKLVFCGKVADAGVNATTLEVIKPELRDEIITRPIQNQLDRAVQDSEVHGMSRVSPRGSNGKPIGASVSGLS